MAGFVLPIISGLAGLLGNRSQKQTQTTNQTQSQTGTQSSQTNPIFSEMQNQLMKMFTQGAGDFYNRGTDLRPYAQSQMQAIGGQGNANRQIIGNILASRGLSYSPAAAAPLTQNAINTGNQQNQFLSQLPLLARQFEQQGLDQLLKSFSAIPTGSSSAGTSSGTSTTQGTATTQTPGNPWAGLLSGVGAALPLAFPGIFGGQQKKLGTVGDYQGADNLSTYTPGNLPLPWNISAGNAPVIKY